MGHADATNRGQGTGRDDPRRRAHLPIEGGFYAIRGQDGVTYDPTNLPDAFRKDGLQVEAVARRRDDMMSMRQVGPIVELERIRAR